MEHPQQTSELFDDFSGYLLRRDDKQRWHRCWCKMHTGNFSVYATAERDQMITSYPLDIIVTQFDPEVSKVCDKEHCFSVASRVSLIGGEGEGEDIKPPERMYFAAYSEAEFGAWKSAFNATVASLHDNPSDVIGGSQSVPQLSQLKTAESDLSLMNKQQLPLPSLPTVVCDVISGRPIVYPNVIYMYMNGVRVLTWAK